MSFFRDLYAKMAPNDTVRKNSFVDNNQYSADLDEYMEEDGFVVFSEKSSSATLQHTCSATNKLEFDNLQRSSPVYSFPSGSLKTLDYQRYGSCKNYTTTTTTTKHESSTFITASDIPMKLARHLELVSKLNAPSSSYIRKPDIGQFYYDFHLEKKTLETRDYNDFR